MPKNSSTLCFFTDNVDVVTLNIIVVSKIIIFSYIETVTIPPHRNSDNFDGDLRLAFFVFEVFIFIPAAWNCFAIAFPLDGVSVKPSTF